MADKARNIRKILSNKKKQSNTTSISNDNKQQPPPNTSNTLSEIDPLTFLDSSPLEENSKPKDNELLKEIKDLASSQPPNIQKEETFTTNQDITPQPNTSTKIAKLLFRMKKSKELDTPNKIITNIFEAKTETTEMSSYQYSNSNINNNIPNFNNTHVKNTVHTTEFNTTPNKLGPPDMTNVQKNKLMTRFASARNTIQNKQLMEKDVIRRTSNKILEKAKLLGEYIVDPALKMQTQGSGIFKEDVNNETNEEQKAFTKKRSNQDIEIFMNTNVILQEKKSFEETILKQSSKEINEN